MLRERRSPKKNLERGRASVEETAPKSLVGASLWIPKCVRYLLIMRRQCMYLSVTGVFFFSILAVLVFLKWLTYPVPSRSDNIVAGRLPPSRPGLQATPFPRFSDESDERVWLEGAESVHEKAKHLGVGVYTGLDTFFSYNSPISNISTTSGNESASSTLGRNISISDLKKIVIDPAYCDMKPDYLCNQPCQGLPCPFFGKCSSNSAGLQGLCFNSIVEDNYSKGLKVEELYPKAEGVFPESEQLLAFETLPVPSFQGNVYILHGVFLNAEGEVFNTTTHFVRGGCYYESRASYSPSSMVHEFDVAVSLVSMNTRNIFHFISEVLQCLLLASRVLKRFPGIPVLMSEVRLKVEDHELIDKVMREWFDLVGWPFSSLRIVLMGQKELIRAKTLIFSPFSRCGQPSASVLEYLRREVLQAPSAPRKCMKQIFASGVERQLPPAIIISQREAGQGRNLLQFDEIATLLRASFGDSQVVSFYGNLSIAETARLFNSACLFISPHGAAMTNMIHLPNGAAVLEIRPREYNNMCFHILASMSHLRYFVTFSNTSRDEHMSVDSVHISRWVLRVLKPYY